MRCLRKLRAGMPDRGVGTARRNLHAGRTARSGVPRPSLYEQSGGGVTFSGGEPLMQFDFVKQCLHLLRDGGVHICLDTSGWGGHAAELAPLVDLFLWDIKHTDAEKRAR